MSGPLSKFSHFFGFLGLLGLCAASDTSFARWVELKDASSVIENMDLDYQVRASGAFEYVVDMRRRVQSEDGRTSASLMTINYVGSYQKVEVLDAYTLNGSQKIMVDRVSIEDREAGESLAYDAGRVVTIPFPQVQVGSRLILRYRMSVSKPMALNQWSDVFHIGVGSGIERYRAKVTSEVPIFFELDDRERRFQVEQKTPQRIDIRMKADFAGVQGEKAPYFFMDRQSIVYVSTDREWTQAMQSFDRGFREVLDQPLSKSLAARVKGLKKLKTEREKIVSLLDWISRDFRYFGDWRRREGGYRPRDLKDIEVSRYGDCKDLSTLLVAVLRAAGFSANVTLVRRGENPMMEEPDYKLPSVNRFNHAIVQVALKEASSGEVLYLDPTNTSYSLKAFADISGRPAWVIGQQKSELKRIPASKLSDYSTSGVYTMDLTHPDRTIVEVDYQQKDLSAFLFANYLMHHPRPEVLNYILEILTKDKEVKSYKFISEPKTQRQVTEMSLKLRFETGRLAYKAGEHQFLVLREPVPLSPLLETTGRESDIELSETLLSASMRTVFRKTKLVGQQSHAGACRASSRWLDFSREIVQESTQVVVKEQVDYKQTAVRQTDFKTKEFAELQKQLRSCFDHVGLLVDIGGW